MDIENAKAQMRKGVLELCVLAVIAPARPILRRSWRS